MDFDIVQILPTSAIDIQDKPLNIQVGHYGRPTVTAREWDHAIDLKPGAPDALDCKVYPMTRDEDAALEKFLDEMVAKGYIRPSKSPYASPFFFVKKKDGKLRPVQDYRRLNSHMVRNQYPLPLIAQLISDLSGAHIFSKVDVRQGYDNVRIKKGDEWKAAFKTKFGHWEPLVMFFSLTNSPSTFQDVTDLQGPPSERTPEQKLWDFKTRAQQYARDRESCDDTRISYLEFLETEAEDDLALARMIAG
jgi:hypothetical protein